MYILQITENKLMMMIVKLKQSVLTQISNHSVTAVIIIHRQRSIMVTINRTLYKIAVRTRTCVTALDRHSQGTVRSLRCSQRPLYSGTNAL